MRDEQAEVYQDVRDALGDLWEIEPEGGDAPIVVVPFEDGTVVVTVAWVNGGGQDAAQ